MGDEMNKDEQRTNNTLLNHYTQHSTTIPSRMQIKQHYCCVVPLWLLSLNPFTEFRIWNNSSSSDVLYIQASISISPKYESKSKTTSHCHLLLHDCTNVAV